jgi:CRISPR-associated protein Cmr1
MRRLPDPMGDLAAPEPGAPPALPPGWARQVRRYRLITPLVGGGVEKMTHDPLTPVRGPALRGQLRFWWRATRGGRFGGDLGALRRREGEIWGAAGGAVQDAGGTGVLLAVELEQAGEALDAYLPGSSRYKAVEELLPGYVSFPLQPTREELNELKKISDRAERARRERELVKQVRVGVAFALTLTYRSAERAELEAALWAWECFGGVGARTRRGCGALACTGVTEQEGAQPPIALVLPTLDNAELPEVRRWLRAQLQRHIPADSAGWPEGVAHLERGQRIGLRPAAAGAIASIAPWLEELKQFRKGLKERGVSDQASSTTRLASPLLIRPLAVGDGFVGMALVLGGSAPPGPTRSNHAATNALRAFPLNDDEEPL